MTQMVVWIHLSNSISVKKWHIKQLYMFWTLVTTFKLTLELWTANWKYAAYEIFKYYWWSCTPYNQTWTLRAIYRTWVSLQKKNQLGRSLENIGILNEGFTHAMVQTTLDMQTLMTNSNHMGCVDGFSRKVLWPKVTR